MTKEEIQQLFKSVPKSVVRTFIKKLRPDFEICGYTDTLAWIESVLD